MSESASPATITEERLRDAIQSAALRYIEEYAIDDAWLAEQLGIAEAGVMVLKRRQHWTLSRSVAVAEALGLDVHVSVKNGRTLVS
jgi:hypothetical protein